MGGARPGQVRGRASGRARVSGATGARVRGACPGPLGRASGARVSVRAPSGRGARRVWTLPQVERGAGAGGSEPDREGKEEERRWDDVSAGEPRPRRENSPGRASGRGEDGDGRLAGEGPTQGGREAAEQLAPRNSVSLLVRNIFP